MNRKQKYIVGVLILCTILTGLTLKYTEPVSQVRAEQRKEASLDELKTIRDQLLIKKEEQLEQKNKLEKDKQESIKKFDTEIGKSDINIKTLENDISIAQAKLDEALKPKK